MTAKFNFPNRCLAISVRCLLLFSSLFQHRQRWFGSKHFCRSSIEYFCLLRSPTRLQNATQQNTTQTPILKNIYVFIVGICRRELVKSFSIFRFNKQCPIYIRGFIHCGLKTATVGAARFFSHTTAAMQCGVCLRSMIDHPSQTTNCQFCCCWFR